jgi:hypothetical protein
MPMTANRVTGAEAERFAPTSIETICAASPQQRRLSRLSPPRLKAWHLPNSPRMDIALRTRRTSRGACQAAPRPGDGLAVGRSW